jgi:hypothetical protein
MPDNITVKTDQWGNAYFKSITTGVKQISATPTANTACAVDWSGEATVVRGEITMTGSALNCGSGEGGIFALVRSPRGDPVGGVEFQVGRFTVITNDQGIFQVGGLPVGDVVVLRLFGASCPDLGEPETVRVLPGTAVAANQFCP